MNSAVEVVIVTFRRPERLRDALASLARAAERAPDLVVGVTVVDDDPDGSAAAVVEETAGVFAGGCVRVECGRQNISAARNAGLEHAQHRGDWVASIDDDVTVPPDWFRTCADALRSGDFDAVTGPLLKDFSRGPSWLRSQPFDQVGILVGVDGEPAFACATGNNWVSAAFLRAHPELRFDLGLGRTGGEDMDFFYRAVEAGLRPVYVHAAGVTETEPPDRCTMRYQLRRAYWIGITEAQVSLRRGKATRGRLVARASRRAVERGRRQLSADDWSRSGLRYQAAIVGQSAGLALGALGATLGHK